MNDGLPTVTAKTAESAPSGSRSRVTRRRVVTRQPAFAPAWKLLLVAFANCAAAASTLRPSTGSALPQPPDFEHSSSAVTVYQLSPGFLSTIGRKNNMPTSSQGPFMAVLLDNPGSGVVSAKQMQGRNCSDSLPAYTDGENTYSGTDNFIEGLIDCTGLTACCLQVQTSQPINATVQLYSALQPTSAAGIITAAVLGSVAGFTLLLYMAASFRQRRLLTPSQYCGVLTTSFSASGKCLNCYDVETCELLSRFWPCIPIVGVALLLTFVIRLGGCICFVCCAEPPSLSDHVASAPALATHSITGAGKTVSSSDVSWTTGGTSPPQSNPIASLQSARADRVSHLKALEGNP
jgi:hypothetical protein